MGLNDVQLRQTIDFRTRIEESHDHPATECFDSGNSHRLHRRRSPIPWSRVLVETRSRSRLALGRKEMRTLCIQ